MLIALCSVKGSPGVTTLAMGLAARWPYPEATRRLVAEVDPSGGDLALRFGLPAAPGLVSLAAVVRRMQDPAAVWEHTQPLPTGARVLVAPPGGLHARAALHTMVTAHSGPVLHALARVPGVVVLADCGRVDHGSPAAAIARRADALLLLCGTLAEDLAHAAARLPELAGWTARPGLVLTGQGYTTSEVERELGVSAVGRIPDDPVAAAAFNGRRTSRVRRRGAGGFEQSVSALAVFWLRRRRHGRRPWRWACRGCPRSRFVCPAERLFSCVSRRWTESVQYRGQPRRTCPRTPVITFGLSERIRHDRRRPDSRQRAAG